VTYSWFSIWYTPEDDDTIAYMTQDRIAEIGGLKPHTITSATLIAPYVNSGIAILSRWCRQNCKLPGTPVNVRGRTGWAFKNSEDALLFKLTWG
jgi:hypothetical protein